MFESKPKLCITCNNLSKGGFGLCYAPENGISPVTGEIQPLLAVSSRSDFRRLNGLSDTGCGPEGKFYVPIVYEDTPTFWQIITKLFKRK